MNKRLIFTVSIMLSIALSLVAAQEKLVLDKYHQPGEITSLLKSWNAKYPRLTKLINIGKSADGKDLIIFRIASLAKNNSDPDKKPAILVSANLEGTHLVGTEAALMLIEKLLTKYGSDEKISGLLENRTVYVAPLLNPDATQGYFRKARYERRANNQPIDNDMDDQLNEDGPDDLNDDGWITQMRVKDPQGEWIPDPKEPRLMKKADAQKGEQGIYKIYSEGLDNDEDGKYNEDPAGGIELNRNFPHDFEYFNRSTGLWPVSAKESIALMQFLITHPNITMVLNFSTENTILNLQQTGRAKAAGDKVKVPERFAAFLGLDANREYGIQELIEILRGMDIFGGQEIDESMIAMMLGLGPAMNIDRQDMPFIEAVQKDYKDALKEAKLDYPEKKAKGVGKGSFVAYCYFHYGVQVFSTDLWAVPEPEKEPKKDALTKDKLKTMSNEEFLALGEEKIDAFLKEQGAPSNFNASMVIKMVESGKVTPARMAEMMEKMPPRASATDDEHPDSYILKWSDTVLGDKGSAVI